MKTTLFLALALFVLVCFVEMTSAGETDVEDMALRLLQKSLKACNNRKYCKRVYKAKIKKRKGFLERRRKKQG